VCTVRYPQSARYALVTVPRSAIASMAKDPEAAAGQRLRKDSEALRLLRHYVSAADNGLSFAAPELRHIFATHVQDLMALAIGATRDGAEVARGRGLRAARLAAIKAEVMANLGRRDLSPDAVAASQGVSASYMRKLFAAEGTSFMDFVLEQRLTRARRMLTDPRLAGRAIGAIALDAGFSDLSYFNRTFRRRFGETPSDVRSTQS
jgi:AraC-like DNA-binding protein